MEDLTIHFEENSLHALRNGGGEKLLLCLHGYGERASRFQPLLRKLEGRYTCYAVDLPLHGKSQGPSKKRLDKTLFVGMLKAILERESADKISLLGFSFGGRLALCLAEKCPELVERLYLIAPDGLPNPKNKSGTDWYRLAQRLPDPLKRGVSKRVLNARLPKITGWLSQRGWLSLHNHYFTETHLASAKKRQRLLSYWLSLKNLQPEWEQLKKNIHDYQLPMSIFLGTRDNVITSREVRSFSQESNDTEVVFLAADHRRLLRVFLQQFNPDWFA